MFEHTKVAKAEWIVAGVVAMAVLGLVVAEPDILEAPVENGRTIALTGGGTVAAACAFVVMLRVGLHPAIRTTVLLVPFVAVSWWTLSPFFLDDVVDDDFSVSIADAAGSGGAGEAETSEAGTVGAGVSPAAPSTAPSPPVGPILLGSGSFIGLAGHEGSGDAGFFALEDGRVVLRFEHFDIENGPDLRLYVVPGADRLSPDGGSLYLGELRGNVGDQTYDVPGDFALTAGTWTVLVWCEAFDVEFVAATIEVT